MAKKELIKVEDENNGLIPLSETPDYLTTDTQNHLGLEGLSREDFKIPRIKLLQPLNPEVQAFPGKAIPGRFWHTGSNIDLGDKFNFIPAIANRRVILFRPRDDGGGILALSRDGRHWDVGANRTFQVKLKGAPEPIQWFTNKDVQSSHLLEWGTENPNDPDSGPAAMLIYEYLVYLQDNPEFSPVVMGCFRTALNNARSFNTSLLMLKRPIQCVSVKASVQYKTENANSWFVPHFELNGYVDQKIFEIVKNITNKHKEYQAEYSPEEATVEKESEAF